MPVRGSDRFDFQVEPALVWPDSGVQRLCHQACNLVRPARAVNPQQQSCPVVVSDQGGGLPVVFEQAGVQHFDRVIFPLAQIAGPATVADPFPCRRT